MILFGFGFLNTIWIHAQKEHDQLTSNLQSKLGKASKDFDESSAQEHISALSSLLTQSSNASEKAEIHNRLGSAYLHRHSQLKEVDYIEAQEALQKSLLHYEEFLTKTTNAEQWLISLRNAALATSLASKETKDSGLEACIYMLSKLQDVKVISKEEEHSRHRKAIAATKQSGGGLAKISSSNHGSDHLELLEEHYLMVLGWAKDFAKSSTEYDTERGRKRLSEVIFKSQVLNDFLEN